MATPQSVSVPSDLAVPVGGMADLISQGIAIVKVENDSMLQVAAQRPRNEQAVLKGAIGELELVPEEAKEAYYSIPYRERQPDGNFRIVNIQGPSIGAAMALARRWGNCSTAARLVNEDKEGFDIEGVFIDLESNFRVSRPFRVGRYGKRRGGGSYLLDEQRLLMAIQAGASKAQRNAILSGLPKYLVQAYYNRARQIVGGKPEERADAKRVEALFKAFDRFKVTKDMLERYCERPVGEWTGEEIANLRGLWNAINDKQVVVDELFAEPSPGNGGVPLTVTPENLKGAPTTAQDNAPEHPRTKEAAAAQQAAEEQPLPMVEPEPEKPAPAPTPAVKSCDHRPIRFFAKSKEHRNKTMVCVDCKVEVLINKDGILSLVE